MSRIMTRSFLQSIRQFVEGNSSVRKVAGDVSLTSELILLVRMMMADGELRAAELENFKRICQAAFGIPQEDVPQVMQYLKDFGYSTTAADAASMFAGFEPERKQALLLHMLAIAKSDDQLDVSEADLIRRTAAILGLTAGDIAAVQSQI